MPFTARTGPLTARNARPASNSARYRGFGRYRDWMAEYADEFARSTDDPEAFWLDAAEAVD